MGFTRGANSDSCCGLAEEASLHDHTSVDRPSRATDRGRWGRHEPPSRGGSVRNCCVHSSEVGAPVARHGQQGAAASGGGDKRSDRIEAHAEEILGLVAATCDITLGEIVSHLERGHGERFAQSVVWRFLDRHAMTFKKNRARQRAGSGGRRRTKASLARHAGRA
jgi:transposase